MHPLLLQINTRCWLRELSDSAGRAVSLAEVPQSEFDRWVAAGLTHIWLMGVWTTGPKCRGMAIREPDLVRAYDEIIPGWTEADVGGSPYAIGDYKVPRTLGGEAGLKEFRAKLHTHGIQLILDFVPNHLGLDHPWLSEQPDLFVQSPVEVPGTFAQETSTGTRWLANGKDPYFLPWNDTVQLDYRRASTRVAMRELLVGIAEQCDGVRCDMAMLLLNDVFNRTWANFPYPAETLDREFWTDAIGAVKKAHPDFLFLAEVYWDLEGRMQELGFDYTYDKRLYDELYWRNAAGAQRRVLGLGREFLSRSAHFLENHDEPRIASQLTPTEQRAAALVILGLPGMRFLHDGQLTGARVKIPCQLARRRVEPVNPELSETYQKLLDVLRHSAIGRGEAVIIVPREAWPGNPTVENFIIVQWQSAPETFDLVVVNLAPHRSQCYAPLCIEKLGDRNWTMSDRLGPETYNRAGTDLVNQGLYLDLPGLGAQVFQFRTVA